MRSNNDRLAAIIAALLFAAPMSTVFAAEGGWDWQIGPVLWAPSLSTSLKLDVPPVETGGTTRFSDVVSKLNFALPLHMEGQGDDWGVLADIQYLSSSQKRTRDNFTTDADQKVGAFELAGVWSPGETRYEGFEVFGGLRYLWAKVDVKITPLGEIGLLPTLDVGLDKSFSDFMLGGRYTAKLSDRWSLTLRGDGSWGGTDGVYTASALFGYGNWQFGYKYQKQKFGAADKSFDIDMYGPVVAYMFKF